MNFTIFTLFPQIFPGFLNESLSGTALEKGLWGYKTINIRDFGLGKHKTVDDTPYGGGAGMVIRPDVLGAALDAHPSRKLVYMSPRGTPLTQQKAVDLSKSGDLSIICGRFEGIDERILEFYGVEEISIGDYVLSGGEQAAMILMDSIIRLLPGVVGNQDTHSEESFTNGLLEYPQYTRPVEWKGIKVPEVLETGNHAKIAKWRKQKSVEITKNRRPDLLKNES